MQELWLDTFKLKSLDDTYTPQHNEAIKEALGAKEIKLQKGSLLKLVSQGRSELIPQIKQVLDEPQLIIKDDRDGILFVKENDKGLFVISVGADFDDYITIISNGLKTEATINNRLNKGQLLYLDKNNQSPSLRSLVKTDFYSQHVSSGNKTDISNSSKKELESQIKVTQNPQAKDEFLANDTLGGSLNAEQKALLEQNYKGSDIKDLSSAKALYNENLQALKTLDELLKNKALANHSQKELLARFRGFGKASNELASIIKEQGKDYEELKNLLISIKENLGYDLHFTQELSPARLLARSVDAYYTPTSIVKSMVKLAESLGLKQDSLILEPSAGVGRFLSSLANKNNVKGVELDPLSAIIAKKLYPSIDIENAPFQNSTLAKDGVFDLVIGNPPYSTNTIKDDSYSALAHNFFMKRGIDKLKENGISIQIITHNFLDASNPKTRLDIAKEAEFLGAVRLPNTAFKDASVTTDIVVFRKAGKDEVLDTSWTKLGEYDGLKINQYFLDHPNHILGKLERVKTLFGEELAVINKDFDISTLDLSTFIKQSPEAFNTAKLELETIFKPKKVDISYKDQGTILFDAKNNSYKIITRKGEAEPFNPRAKLLEYDEAMKPELIEKRLSQYKAIKPQIDELMQILKALQAKELDPNADDFAIEALRKMLNEKYDKLVGKSSLIQSNKATIQERFRAYSIIEPNAFEFFALEKEPLLKDLGNGKRAVIGSVKADIFKQRVSKPYIRPDRADSLEDALKISLNENGYIHTQRMSELLQKNPDEIQDELLEKRLMYIDQEGRTYDKASFLSGNVKEKLARFYDENKALKLSSDEKIASFQRQALEDLKAIIPHDIELADIHVPLGATYLPKEMHESFFKEVLEMQEVQVSYTKGLGFRLDKTQSTRADFHIQTGKEFAENTNIKAINASSYIQDMMNNESLVVQYTKTLEKGKTKLFKDPIASKALERLKKSLTKEFKRFLQDDENLALQAQKLYNDRFNAIVLKKYDGSHLSFIGMNENIRLRPHQKDAVFRSLQENRTLLAHDVGTGKTYTMVASALELKRLGLVSKSMIVTPNNVAVQLASEARRLYPNARIKLINSISARAKNTELASLKNNDFDLIVATYTAFERMNVSYKAYENYMQIELKELNRLAKDLQNDPNASLRQLKGVEIKIENTKNKIQQYLQKIQSSGQNVFFDDLGIDNLMFDEAHYLKSLPIITRQRNVRGISGANSNRAIDAYVKILNMQDKRVLFATGTPVTNYISDIYVMQRYLQPKSLSELNIDGFDEWSKMYAGISTEFELKATQTYKETARMRDFENLRELKLMVQSVADIVTKEDMKALALEQGIKINEPKIQRINITLDRSEKQVGVIEEGIQRAKELEDNPFLAQEKGGDNHLKILSDINKASLDMRLLDPSLPRDENSKVVKASEAIFENYKAFEKQKGTQLVFLDSSTPSKKISGAKLAKLKAELGSIEKKLDDEEVFEKFSSEAIEKMTKQKEDISDEIASAENAFSLYDELKELLVQKGIKADEIAFVHDYDTNILKQKLSDMINEGKIRVLIGSTRKMGAGANYQRRLVALHHLDFTWTASDMAQREGRIIRQGNIFTENDENFTAKIYTYVTKQMSDSIMFETLARKQDIISAITNKDLNIRRISDTSEDNFYLKMKASSSPNAELEMEHLKLMQDYDNLENELVSLKQTRKNNERKIINAENLITKTQANLAYLDEFLKAFKDKDKLYLDEKLFDLGKKAEKNQSSMKEKANAVLDRKMKGFYASTDELIELGKLSDMKLLALKNKDGVNIYLGQDLQSSLKLVFLENNTLKTSSSIDYIQRIKNSLAKVENGSLAEGYLNSIALEKESIERAKKLLANIDGNKLTSLQDELDKMSERMLELKVLLGKATQEDLSFFANTLQVNKDFGENYIEFFNKPIEAFEKLKMEQKGQVVGAYHRKDLGSIDLVWGEVFKDEKGQIQGYGLSKILEKHPEITAELLAEIMAKGKLDQGQNRAFIIYNNFKVVISLDYKGKTARKWIITAFEKAE